MVWIGFLGGAVFWSLHLLLSYLAVAMSCRGGWTAEVVASLGGTVPVLHVLSVLAVGGTLACGAAAVAVLRRGEGPRHRGLASVGLGLDAIFLVAILFAASSVFLVPVCG